MEMIAKGEGGEKDFGGGEQRGVSEFGYALETFYVKP